MYSRISDNSESDGIYVPTIASKIPRRNRVVISLLKLCATAVQETITPNMNTLTNTMHVRKFVNVNGQMWWHTIFAH
jgi:hypothetical protein